MYNEDSGDQCQALSRLQNFQDMDADVVCKGASKAGSGGKAGCCDLCWTCIAQENIIIIMIYRRSSYRSCQENMVR